MGHFKSGQSDTMSRKFFKIIRYFDTDEDYCLEKVNIEDVLSKASAAKEFICLGEQDQKKFNKT